MSCCMLRAHRFEALRSGLAGSHQVDTFLTTTRIGPMIARLALGLAR